MVPVFSINTPVAPAATPTDAERALHSAARSGDRSLARALLQAGVPVDAGDERGRTALMLAAERGEIGLIEELVEAGAALDARDAGKRRWPALMYALDADRPDAAVALLRWGADPRVGDDSGYSALMMAARSGERRVVEELLQRGADPTAELFLGFTALDYAIGYGHVDIVRLLLSAAPHLRARHNPARRAVLALADSAGDEEILRLLA